MGRKKKKNQASCKRAVPLSIDASSMSAASPATSVSQDPTDFAINNLLRDVLRWSIEGPKNLQESMLVGQLGPKNADERLHLACELGETALVASMLDAGQGNVNSRSKDGSTPLLIASKRGHVEVAKLLINQQGTDLDCMWVGNTSATPLILWCEHSGCDSVVKLLLQKGASPHLADEHGTTPLFEAAKHNNKGILPLLLKHHTDPNRKRVDGSTSVVIAAEKGHEEVLELLYKSGGDLGSRLKCGSTCLSLAVQNRHREVVKRLLEWGCVANTIDEEGRTPLWIASAHGHEELVAPLFYASPGMALLDDKEQKANPIEAALRNQKNDTFSTLTSLLLQFSGQPLSTARSLVQYVSQNILLAVENKEKLSYAKLLGLENLAMEVSAEAWPRLDRRVGDLVPLDQHGSGGHSALAVRQQGNDRFKAKDFKSAIALYERAMELDPHSPLAASNASEAALQLRDYSTALAFARKAYDIDPSHKKTWFRKAKSLAGLNRTAEAYVWIANQAAKGKIDREDQIQLVHTASEESPCCYDITPGLIIERCALGNDHQYRVVTTKPILVGEVVSKEIAVVPWVGSKIKSDEELVSFLDSIAPAQVESVAGIFPRSSEEIPWDLESLRSSKARIRKLKPSASEHEIIGWCRAYACAKVCSFDNGIHHFASFFNHSCEPNCEVRSLHNLEVVANQNIKAGQELCITYMGSMLDCHVVARQQAMLNWWGNRCWCSRCFRERKGLIATDETLLERQNGKNAVKAFEEEFVSELRQSGFSYPPALPDTEVLSNWQDYSWKRAIVLIKESEALTMKVSGLVMNFALSTSSLGGVEDVTPEKAIALVTELVNLERKGAIQCLQHLIHQKRTYLPKTSTALHPLYQLLHQLVDLFLSAGILSTEPGFSTEKQLISKKRELLELLEDASTNSSFDAPPI